MGIGIVHIASTCGVAAKTHKTWITSCVTGRNIGEGHRLSRYGAIITNTDSGSERAPPHNTDGRSRLGFSHRISVNPDGNGTGLAGAQTAGDRGGIGVGTGAGGSHRFINLAGDGGRAGRREISDIPGQGSRAIGRTAGIAHIRETGRKRIGDNDVIFGKQGVNVEVTEGDVALIGLKGELGRDVWYTAGRDLPTRLRGSTAPCFGLKGSVANADAELLPLIAVDAGHGLLGNPGCPAVSVRKGPRGGGRAGGRANGGVVKKLAGLAAGVGEIPIVSPDHVGMLAVHIAGNENNVIVPRGALVGKAGLIGEFNVGGGRDVRNNQGVLVRRGAARVGAVIKTRRTSLGPGSPGGTRPGSAARRPTGRNGSGEGKGVG